MLKHKILNLPRKNETKQIVEKIGFIKTQTKEKVEIEPWDDYCARIEKTLDEWAEKDWTVVSMSYFAPSTGNISGGYSTGRGVGLC